MSAYGRQPGPVQSLMMHWYQVDYYSTVRLWQLVL